MSLITPQIINKSTSRKLVELFHSNQIQVYRDKVIVLISAISAPHQIKAQMTIQNQIRRKQNL